MAYAEHALLLKKRFGKVDLVESGIFRNFAVVNGVTYGACVTPMRVNP